MSNIRELKKLKLEWQKQARESRWSRKWAIIEQKRKMEEAQKQIEESIPVETTPEIPVAQSVTEQAIEEAPFPQSEQPSIPQPSSVRPSEYPVPKEAAIKISTEPTVIESAGVISQEKAVEPVVEFIFRLPDGNEVGRANNLDGFFELIRRGPLDSILYHANEGHFITWLEFKGYKKLAKKIKNIKGTSKKVRKRLLKIISRNR